MISTKDIQRYLKNRGLYRSSVDGIAGPQTRAAIDAALPAKCSTWSAERRAVAIQQVILADSGCYVGIKDSHDQLIDGYIGPNTRAAWEVWQNVQAASETDDSPNKRWPTRKQVRDFYGEPGDHLVSVTVPYTLRLAWAPTERVLSIRCHKKVKDSLLNVLEHVLQEYGQDQISYLGLDLYAGCYQQRTQRLTTALSLHSWGIAIDWHSEANMLRWDHTQAAFARPAYDKWWRLWEQEGWVSYGREKDFDWMHVQAARL
jgi:hypothetical protein